MEATISNSWTRGANLRRWLRRPDCPKVIRQFKALFEKGFPSYNHPQMHESSNRSGEPAHHVHAGVRYSKASTHLGNSIVIYYASADTTSPIVGSIQKIFSHPNGGASCKIRRYVQVPVGTYNPFQRYPFFPAMLYTSTLDSVEDTVAFTDILGHASRFDISNNRSIFVNMSRA